MLVQEWFLRLDSADPPAASSASRAGARALLSKPRATPGSVRSTGLGPSGARCARALPGARSCVAAEAKVEQVAIE